MEKVVIFGTSSGAVLAHFYLTHDSPYEVAGFTVDRAYIKEKTLCGLPVVPFEDIESTFPPDRFKMLVAVLASRVNMTRAEKYAQAKARGYRFISYVSSRAGTWPDLEVGENSFIGEFSVCRPFLKIGDNVMIMAATFLGHNTTIMDHCFIAARAVLMGAVTLEPYCCVGANATILDGVKVARECVIGAGAVIHEDTQEKGVYRTAPPTLLPLPSHKMSHMLFRSRDVPKNS
jgi:sugar O-acyltransferase (sialic acid O-acetyltransferase NeuD family)